MNIGVFKGQTVGVVEWHGFCSQLYLSVVNKGKPLERVERKAAHPRIKEDG